MKNLLILGILLMTAANFWLVLQTPKTPRVVAQFPPPYSALPPEQPATPKPIAPEFVQVPVYRSQTEKSVLGDIIAHSRQAPHGNGSGRGTNAHETTHGIHSEVRNEYIRKLGRRVNAFYCLDGRAVVVDEPRMRKRDVIPFVPQSLKEYRYNLYLAGQTEWDDTPLYIFDEWQAYINGGACDVDDVQQGRYKGGWTDGVMGCLEFSVYATALAMAVEKHDPEYWKNNKQFRAYVHFALHESYRTYMIGSKMEQFKWDRQDALLERLRVSPDAAQMREFLKNHFDGIWL